MKRTGLPWFSFEIYLKCVNFLRGCMYSPILELKPCFLCPPFLKKGTVRFGWNVHVTNEKSINYRPQRNVMFSEVFLSHSVHMRGAEPAQLQPPRQTPWRQTPCRQTPEAHPLVGAPQEANPLVVTSSCGYCSGWYASYWNAFLFHLIFTLTILLKLFYT